MPRWPRRSTALGLAALAVLAGAGTAYATVSTPGPRYRLATVIPAQVSAAIDVVGTLSPAQQADVPFPVSGTVATVAVRSGQRVTAGQRLGSLSKASLRAALAAAQSTLDQANLQVSHDIAGQDQAASGAGSGSGSGGSGSGSGSAGGSASAALRPLQQAVLRAQRRADQALARARAALAQAGQVCTSPAPSPSGTPSASRTPVPGAAPSAGATPSLPGTPSAARTPSPARAGALPRRPPRRPRRATVRTPPSRCWRPRPWCCTPSRRCPGSCPRSARRWPRRCRGTGTSRWRRDRRRRAAAAASGLGRHRPLVRARQRGPAGRRPGHGRCRRGAAHRRAAEPGQRHRAQPDQRHRGQRGGQPGHGGQPRAAPRSRSPGWTAIRCRPRSR